MLQVGQGDFPNTELARIRTHFGMWSLMKSTLLLSTVLDWLTPAVIDILSNHRVIAIHQDSLVVPAKRVASTPPNEEAALDLRPPNHANLAIAKCQPGNSLQLRHWETKPKLDASGRGTDTASSGVLGGR